MNSFMEQNLAEEHRKDIIREFSDIRLQELALKSKVSHPNWFTHIMQKLGQWLMARGEKMAKHYEFPASSTTTLE
jgi:hypothetical protein